MAINERTYLTLVVRLQPIGNLRDRVAAAMYEAVLSEGVPRAAAERECELLKAASFVRLRDPALRQALEFAALEADSHGAGGQDDRSIQDMLNTYPYDGCPASCPTEAVTKLFGVQLDREARSDPSSSTS